MESWEIHWKDYYQILQVDSSTEQEVIEATYRKLARRYHPDVDNNPTSHERMKDLNEAFEYLGDPGKRSEYHSEWLRRSREGKAASTGYVAPKPKPVVEPDVIRFKNVKSGEIRTASFTINNNGGPYEDIWFDDPGERGSWVRVVGYQSTTADELPLEVIIEAEGEAWGENYTENIGVKLDEEETQVRIELQTQPEPVGAKAGISGVAKAAPPSASPPPVKIKNGMPSWEKWLSRALILGLAIGIIFGAVKLVGWVGESSLLGNGPRGIVIYLSPSETPVPLAFADIKTSRWASGYPDMRYTIPLIDSSGHESDIPLKDVTSITFGTIPYSVMQSWPDNFGGKPVPRINVELELTSGYSNTYQMYATYWIYIVTEEGKQVSMHPCRIQEIQFHSPVL